VVVAGGLLPGDSSSGTAYRLDLGSGRSRRLPPLPVAVHDTAAAVDRGHVLVVGGGNALEQDSVQALGPHGWTVRGHLPGPRSDLSTATVDGTTYVVGGYDGSTPALPEVVASRDGRHWTTVTRLPVPVRYAATVAVGHRLWVLGGERAGAMVDVVQVVDARAGTARVVAHLRHRVGHAMAVPLHGRILLMGGRRSTDRVTRRAWWVDPATHAVRSAGRLPYPLADAAAVPGPHGTCYLLGGETPTVTARVLEVRAR
jgi:N-acetylneuraminic acid mutarotase